MLRGPFLQLAADCVPTRGKTFLGCCRLGSIRNLASHVLGAVQRACARTKRASFATPFTASLVPPVSLSSVSVEGSMLAATP